jgi:RHS repeat-associated protein
VDRNGNKIAINRSTSDPSRITSVNDPYGRQLLFYYNDQGQCTRIEPPGGGRSLEFAYGSTSGRLYRITDMVRNTAEYEYNSDGELYSIRNGTPVQYVEVDPGSPAPDLPAGIPVRRANVSYAPRTADSQDPLQGFRVHEVRENGLDPVMYEPVSGKPGQVRRTSRGQKPFIYGSNPQKKVESFTDPLGNTSLIGYENSLPSSLTTPNGDQTRIQYNASGFPIMATNPLGQASRYEYKGGTGLVTRYIPPGLTSDQSWRIEYNDSHNPIRVTSPLGRVTEMTYGTRGQLLTVRDPAGHVTTSTYDKYGNLLSVRRPGDPAAMQLTWDETGLLCTRIADPLGHTKDFVYDANDRLNRITWSSLAGTPSIVLEWDASHQRRLSDELGNATLFEHNLFGLRTSTTSPLGQVRRHAYDADNRLVVSHDPLSRGTAREYDDSGRLTVVRHPIGESRRTYDKEGRQIAYQTPRGDVTQFSNDKNGCRIQAAPTGLAPVNFSYTVRNELASVTNARGQTISYAYNLDGEVTSRSIPGLGQDAYAYDSRGNLIAMTSAQGASNSRTYDANGRVVQMRWPKPGGGDWIADFVYDAADRLIRIAYPDGSVIDYTHDARNRTALPAALRNASLREAIPPEAAAMPLAAAWSKGGGVWRASAATDAAGNLLSLSRPNGVATQWTYDAARRVTSVLHRRGDDTFLSQALTYNADDTTASSAYSFPHVFVRPSSLAVTYSAHDRIETFGDNAPEYDGDGNCLTGPAGGFSAAYDALNRLLSMTRGGVTRSFVYDARDLLAGWTEGSATRNLHRDAAGHILFESDGEGRIVALHIRYGGWLLARGLPESGWSYYHFDRNGNTLALTNASGAVSASYQYMPFGLQRVSGVPGDSFLTYGGGHGVIDHGAGLHHMGRRAYHVDSQRFLQKDPLGYDGGDNLYAYANGNPVDFIDPQGTKSFMGFASGVLNAGVRAVGAPFYLAAKTYETYLGPHSDYAEKEREGYQTLIAAAEGRKSQAMARDPKAGAWGNRWDAAKKKLSDKISGTQDVAYSETGELAVEVGKEIAQNIVLAPITRGSQVAEVAVGTTLEYLGSDE